MKYEYKITEEEIEDYKFTYNRINKFHEKLGKRIDVIFNKILDICEIEEGVRSKIKWDYWTGRNESIFELPQRKVIYLHVEGVEILQEPQSLLLARLLQYDSRLELRGLFDDNFVAYYSDLINKIKEENRIKIEEMKEKKVDSLLRDIRKAILTGELPIRDLEFYRSKLN